jgi:hypothetical protein
MHLHTTGRQGQWTNSTPQYPLVKVMLLLALPDDASLSSAFLAFLTVGAVDCEFRESWR